LIVVAQADVIIADGGALVVGVLVFHHQQQLGGRTLDRFCIADDHHLNGASGDIVVAAGTEQSDQAESEGGVLHGMVTRMSPGGAAMGAPAL
jgi:hypothetical protein